MKPIADTALATLIIFGCLCVAMWARDLGWNWPFICFFTLVGGGFYYLWNHIEPPANSGKTT